MTPPGKENTSRVIDRASSATIWGVVEVSGRYGLQFFVTIFLARLLSPQDFGLVAMVLVFTSVALVIVDGGFGEALIQRRDLEPSDESTAFAANVLLGVLVAVGLWYVAPWVARFYAQQELALLFRTVLWVVPIGALAAVPDSLLTRRLQFKERAVAQAVASFLGGLVAVTLAIRGFGVWSLVWQVLSATIIRTVLVALLANWRPICRPNFKSFTRLLSFGGYLMVGRLLNNVFMRTQLLLIGKLHDPEAAGYYTLAQGAQQAPASLVNGVLNKVGLPTFAEVSGDSARLKRAVRFSLSAAMFVFLPLMVGLAFIAEPFIILVYGERWAPAAPIFSILAIASVFIPANAISMAALTAQGRSQLFFRLSVLKRFVGIVMILIFSVWGAVGVALGVLGSQIFSSVLNAYYTNKYLGYSPSAQIMDQASTGLLCALAAIPGWIVLHVSEVSWISTGAAIISAGILYVGLALLFRSRGIREFLKVLQTNNWKNTQKPA